MKIKKVLDKKIYLATDHAGFEYKEKVKKWLEEQGADFEDMGAFDYDKNDDYPDWISQAAEKISQNPDSSLGIIFGGSGQGEAMVANKYPHIRAAVYYGMSGRQIDINGNEIDILQSSKLHNNANILSIGARFVPEEDLIGVVKYWLSIDFSDEERNIRRIKKIDELKINKK